MVRNLPMSRDWLFLGSMTTSRKYWHQGLYIRREKFLPKLYHKSVDQWNQSRKILLRSSQKGWECYLTWRRRRISSRVSNQVSFRSSKYGLTELRGFKLSGLKLLEYLSLWPTLFVTSVARIGDSSAKQLTILRQSSNNSSGIRMEGTSLTGSWLHGSNIT